MRVRDPFILLHEGCYYMYRGFSPLVLGCVKSTDLENWEEIGTVFEIPTDGDFWAYRDIWAPEVHKHNGKFYLFASLLGKNGLRGTQVAVSDTPCGPFIPVKNAPITPQYHSCIDGSLYVHNGVPYVVYSHDWPDCYSKEKSAYVGEIWALQVDDALVNASGEPFRLFTSDESPVSKAVPHRIIYNDEHTMRYGSDGPFVQRLECGALFLTWSPYLENNYVVLSAVSESGDIKGPWKHSEKAFYGENGGHAMFFKDMDGTLKMCLHAPEAPPAERAHIFTVEEKGATLEIIKEI